LIAFLAVTPTLGSRAQAQEERFDALREQMVEYQIVRRGVDDEAVCEAMRRVPRHLFVPSEVRDEAYVDHPVPIGQGQTISQPYIVALMTSLLDLSKTDRVLEIGTGSGYQAAVLGEIAGMVYTIEIREDLGLQAKGLLQRLGYSNVHVRIGNGYRGWPEEAPFDAIIVTASPPDIPETLVAQLKVGGRMVVPVGAGAVQNLELLTKTPNGVLSKDMVPVRFVPMIGDRD
jgi:protein-L-isoaspartate(D-aspartate) O-methyltransferase